MKTLVCFYDMAVSPCSYDFFTFMYSAEICRIRRSLDDINLILVQGPKNKFRNDEIRSDEQNQTFFDNVILPGISLLNSCSKFMWVTRDQVSNAELPKENIFPRGYTRDRPTAEYVAHALVASKIRGDKHSFLESPYYARALADSFIEKRLSGNKFVTVTSREISRDNINDTRTLKINVWQKAINAINNMGISVLIIRDTSTANDKMIFDNATEVPEASIHLPLRMAFYERALINFTKNNGPGTLQLYSKSRTVYFNSFDDEVKALSKSWFATNYGMDEGDQYPFTTQSKKYIWNNECTDVIVNSVKSAQNNAINNEKINEFTNQNNIKLSILVAVKHLIASLKFGILDEDIDLYQEIRKLNLAHKIFDDFDTQFKKLSEEHIDQLILKKLIGKSEDIRPETYSIDELLL